MKWLPTHRGRDVMEVMERLLWFKNAAVVHWLGSEEARLHPSGVSFTLRHPKTTRAVLRILKSV